MTLRFFDITALITAINAAGTDLKSVAHAWTAEPIEDLGTEAPAAFVYLSGEPTAENTVDNDVRMNTDAVISVITVAPTSILATARAQVFNGALGYQQDVNFDALEHIGGGLVGKGLVGKYCWWKDDFITKFIRYKT